MDSAITGPWCRGQLAAGELHAPHLLPAEVTNVLRRAVSVNPALRATAQQGLADLAELGIAFHDFLPFRSRVWELRHNLSSYDAWYVALAEALDAPLVTLDHRLAHAPGIRCQILTAERG